VTIGDSLGYPKPIEPTYQEPYGIKLVADEQTDLFPWAVVGLNTGTIIQRYNLRAVADRTADNLNIERYRNRTR
jgi:hypothetical protein